MLHIHACCKQMFQVFLGVSYVCLQVFYLDVAYVCNYFSSVLHVFQTHVSNVRLQLFHLDVSKVDQGVVHIAM